MAMDDTLVNLFKLHDVLIKLIKLLENKSECNNFLFFLLWKFLQLPPPPAPPPPAAYGLALIQIQSYLLMISKPRVVSCS